MISSWMEQTPSVHSSCAPQSLGKWSCYLRARHGIQILADVDVTHHGEKVVPPESTTSTYKFSQMPRRIPCAQRKRRTKPYIPRSESIGRRCAATHSAPECASQCPHRSTFNRLPAVQVLIPSLQHRARQISLPTARSVHARSGASRWGPRAWVQVCCIFHDPGQRGASCSSTAFRRSPFGLHQSRFHDHWRLRQWSLHHPLGEHRGPFSLLLDAFYLSRHRSDGSMHESSMFANSLRRRSLLVDVELVFRVVTSAMSYS